MTKSYLRKLYKQKRVEIPTSQRMKLDDLLLIQFQRLTLPDDLHTLMTFWPLQKQAEVNTDLYTRYLKFMIPNLLVAYPVVNIATQQMMAAIADEHTDFVENVYAIPEPVNNLETLISPQSIDIVFVPLLSFDKQGLRVGYGKGYYDRFLNSCRRNVCKVGFSYFEAVDKIDDTHQYDVPLNYCITPERIYEF